MHSRVRLLLLALGLFSTTRHASAQFIELVTEAPVTITATITTTKTVESATERKTTPTVTSLKHADIVADIVAHLRAKGLIAADAPSDGWSLVSVNYAPADTDYVDAGGYLYAVNGSTRVFVPSDKFAIEAHMFRSAAKYKERHLGRYFLDSSGTLTNHVSYNYLAKLNVGDTPYTITDMLTDGFANISFTSKNASDGQTVFFFAISSLRASARGSFVADLGAGATGQGLITLNVANGAPKLVPASNYPDVPTFPEGGF